MRRSFSPDQALTASTRVLYEVLTRDGLSTGRRFSRRESAQRYADGIGGTVTPKP